MTELNEQSLEAALIEMRRATEAAGNRIRLQATQVTIPPDTVAWLDEVAPPGWRERAKAWKPSDNLITIIFGDAAQP